MALIPPSATARAVICAAILSIADVQSNALAQNAASSKATQNAAGLIILNGVNQQNAMRKELHETKEELKAIREGLGIERSSEPSESLSAAQEALQDWEKWNNLKWWGGIVSFWLLLACGSAVYWFLTTSSFSKADKTAVSLAIVRDLSFIIIAVTGFFFICVIPSFFGVKPGDPLHEMATGGSLLGAAAFLGICVKLRLRLSRKSDAAALLTKAGAKHWLRLPGGEIRGPCYERDVLAAVAAGAYAANTEWGVSKTGPWKPLVTADTYWLKTPKGRSGGPYKREQIRMAIKKGQIPQGSEMSQTANGPWVKIDLTHL
jgi:hypothetical protein